MIDSHPTLAFPIEVRGASNGARIAGSISVENANESCDWDIIIRRRRRRRRLYR
jgi:hypothetical protein